MRSILSMRWVSFSVALLTHPFTSCRLMSLLAKTLNVAVTITVIVTVTWIVTVSLYIYIYIYICKLYLQAENQYDLLPNMNFKKESKKQFLIPLWIRAYRQTLRVQTHHQLRSAMRLDMCIWHRRIIVNQIHIRICTCIHTYI